MTQSVPLCLSHLLSLLRQKAHMGLEPKVEMGFEAPKQEPYLMSHLLSQTPALGCPGS